ncbi:YggU family protein [bacterium]|nr:MAG: YggU family protein [bacterium]
MASNPQEPILIRIKAVPGASRDAIAGLLGDRLKIRISAAPEDGKANKAICKLLAKALDIKPAQIEIYKGHTNPEKTVKLVGCSLEHISRALDIDAAVIQLEPN